MLRRILRTLRDRLVTSLTPPRQEETPTVKWLNRLRREFKKKRLDNPSPSRLDVHYNPLSMEEDISCPCQYAGGHRVVGCPFHPEKDTSRNDDRRHPPVMGEGLFAPQRSQ
jgi:hypothetical protein